MMRVKNAAYSLDSECVTAMFICHTGQQDFTYSPLDTPATASGGVIHY